MGRKLIKQTYTFAFFNNKIFHIYNNGFFHLLPSPPLPNVSVKTLLHSLVTEEHDINYNNYDFKLIYYSYAHKLEVVLFMDDTCNFTIGSKEEEPIDEIIEEVLNPLFDVYIPTLGYTKNTSRTISLMSTHSNKVIMPMIVVGTDIKLDNYMEDNLSMSHFLDLGLIQASINLNERIQIAESNKGKARNQKIKLPKRIFSKIEKSKIYEYYLNLKNINFIIPVYRIDVNQKASLEDAENILSLLNRFKKIAFRVNKKRNEINNLESYLLSVANNLDDVYILLEENLKNKKSENNDLMYIDNLSKKIKLAFIGEHVVSNIDENENIISKDHSFIFFKNLQQSFPNLMYGDYCGFEKDTAVASLPIIATTARLFYTDPDNIEQYIVRRQRDESNDWKPALNTIQLYIQENKPKHIQLSHCEACRDILTGAIKYALGPIKENSIIHNGICKSRA
jgi:hypothetical protein